MPISGGSYPLSGVAFDVALEGPQGAAGPPGPQGPQGNNGAKGDQGTSGAQGSQGPPGATGPTGPVSTVPGPQGVQGVQGVQGPPGAQGAQGAASNVPGPAGAQGAQGLPGTTGATGATGSQGPVGPTGPQGATGAAGPPGGLGEAPIDGLTYGRKNATWSQVTGGGGSVSEAPLDSKYYTRFNATWVDGDTIFATDAALTAYAPLASPTFTGDPKAPTATAGDNDTSIATTAFVTSAVAVATVPPAIVAPGMDGVAAVGVATKYAREDHKHPTDTSREPTITVGTTAQYYRGDKVWQTLDKTAVGLANVDNTSDANKPVSAAQAAADALKANIASPVFTGDPQAPTPATADNDTSIATTAFVKAQGYLTVVPVTYAPLASPIFTGDPQAPTPLPADNDTSIATTAFVKAQGYLTTVPATYAPLANPVFTGDPQAPTPAAGDSDTSIATTAFVANNFVPKAATTTISAGYTFIAANLGTLASFTLSPALGNYQYGTNNAAFTLTAPTVDCAVDILITNGATAGAITFTGFTVGSNIGDAIATTNGSKFIISIRRINAIATYVIKALQ